MVYIKSLSGRLDEKAIEKTNESFNYLTSGYEFNLEDLLSNASYEFKSNQTIIIKDIFFISLCKHHALPFSGRCDIEYLSKDKIIGLSRIKKIIKVLSLRLQLQEALTKEILDALTAILDPLEIIVTVKARHACMMINDQNHDSEIITIEKYKRTDNID